jgi:hypothetical protein
MKRHPQSKAHAKHIRTERSRAGHNKSLSNCIRES